MTFAPIGICVIMHLNAYSGGLIVKKRIVGYYGRVVLEKEWCEDCQMYAFLFKNELQCCGKKISDAFAEDRRLKHVRFSQGSGKRKSLTNLEKEIILQKQRCKCIYCDVDLTEEEVHFDHFVPFSFTFTGAKIGDYVAACKDCNLLKSNKFFDCVEDVRNDLRGKSNERRERRKKRRLPTLQEGIL